MKNQASLKKLLSVEETSQILGVSSRTLFNMAVNGELPCIKIGKSVRYDPVDLQAYIDRNRTPAVASSTKIKKTVVVHDEASNYQAIYVDGVLAGQYSTLYAHDISRVVGGPECPFTLEQRCYEDVGEQDWPLSLVELEGRMSQRHHE